jgi:hypothetical protein
LLERAKIVTEESKKAKLAERVNEFGTLAVGI